MTTENKKLLRRGKVLLLKCDRAIQNVDGSLKPLFDKRIYTSDDDRFNLVVTNLADPYGKVPIAKMFINKAIYCGWRGVHTP
jgi:hypothetical protein